MGRQSWIVFIFLLVALGMCGCMKPVRVEGTAMAPTLNDGDPWLVTISTDKLERGDIIEFRYPKDEAKRYVKRIIGLPGERIEIRMGKVFINGQALAEDYLDPSFNQGQQSFPERTVPDNKFFVMGDNRDNSSDSRYWGPVDRSLIEGKLYRRYFGGGQK